MTFGPKTFGTSRRTALGALAFAAMLGLSPAARAADENTVYLDTKDGRVTIELRADLAPKHVAQLKTLIKQGFYDGLKFHRVMDGFMAQTGDPKGNGTGGSSLPNIPAEFSSSPFRRGTVGMARSSEPNSANSQFFICLGDASFLNGQYTVVGVVSSGMEAVDAIKKAAPGSAGGAVQNPDKIVKMQMAQGAK
ncbi:peptidylprolyl isomerase [Methylobacterium sp. BTF04]|uniref:peptidylprolyl isomerase n=1 Tax=Methylobacterium sp. BTF04 TaxID=2708300 RepID=UPI0013D85D00|nr:peptidylprolyl isomerase [Methylobacterium sp. BTF04]NEU11448.1 peptidylprolyl isomerase [Methylobacterium sp. BTF04]